MQNLKKSRREALKHNCHGRHSRSVRQNCQAAKLARSDLGTNSLSKEHSSACRLVISVPIPEQSFQRKE